MIIVAGIFIFVFLFIAISFSLKAWENNRERKKILNDVNSRYASSLKNLGNEVEKANKSFDFFANQKKVIFESTIHNFFETTKDLTVFEPLQECTPPEENNIEPASQIVINRSGIHLNNREILLAGTAAFVSSVAAVEGTKLLVTSFGHASTGAAISQLTGVYAHNASMANLGGGALYAGGGGMKMGTAMLGLVGFAAALAAGAIVLELRSEKYLRAAKEYSGGMEEKIRKINDEISHAKNIHNTVENISDILFELDTRLIEKNKELRKVNKSYHLLKFRVISTLILLPLIGISGFFNYLYISIPAALYVFLNLYVWKKEKGKISLSKRSVKKLNSAIKLFNDIQQIMDLRILDSDGKLSAEAEKLSNEYFGINDGSGPGINALGAYPPCR